MTPLPGTDPSSARPALSRSETLSVCWQERGIEPDALQIRNGTLVSPRGDSARTATIGGLRSLFQPAASGMAPFQMGATLGEGGMGVVRSATQTALDRGVAIKSLRVQTAREHMSADNAVSYLDDKPQHRWAAAQLVLEARVAGALEHPNIVPIHTLGHDGYGLPLIVMKRIDGVSWDARLRQVDVEQRRTDSYLRKHLAILKQVAGAVHFAHSRGIVHRDIKPSNVMVGDYDEVYLADWGLAAALRDGVVRGLKLARSIQTVEGTPGYLAPEMAIGEGEQINERTDVYLLGATLFHIVCGEPPHTGNGLREVLSNAFTLEPEWPDWVPDGLRLIGQRAMSFDACDRFASARAFARAIDDFLVHRSSNLLSDAAHERLAHLRRLIDQERLEQQRSPQAAPTGELQACFRECRFAFGQALSQWPDNRIAHRGLQHAVELMVDFELSRGALAAAELLLPELLRPSDDLHRRIDDAKARQTAERERLDQLRHDADLQLGARQRKIAAYVVAPLWALCFISFGLFTRFGVHTIRHWEVALVDAVFLIALLLRNPVGAETKQFNDVNRRMLHSTRLAFAVVTCIWAGAPVLELSLPATSVLHLLVSGTIWATMTINIERAMLPMPLIMAAGLLAVLRWPGYHFELLGISGGAGALVAARGYGRS